MRIKANCLLGFLLFSYLLAGCSLKPLPSPAINKESSLSTDTWSSAFRSVEEKLLFLAKYMEMPSEVQDAEYHIVYHDNSGGMIPGPSDWDIRVALVIEPDNIYLWTDGMKKLVPGQIDVNDIWDELKTESITWQDNELVEYWKRPDFPVYLVVFPESGILLKMMSTRHQPT